jgi:hypothetical protein
MKQVLAVLGAVVLFACNKERIELDKCKSLQGVIQQERIGNEWVTYQTDTIGFVYCSDTTEWDYIGSEYRMAQKKLTK